MRLVTVFAAAVLALAIATTSCRADPPRATPEQTPFRTTSTVRDVMQSLVAPSAQGLWESVGTISNAKGTVHLEPRTDEEWAAVRRHGVALVESTNLLLIPGRHIAPANAQVLRADDADPGAELAPDQIEKRVTELWPVWTAMAHALHDAAINILTEIDKKDVAGLERTGSDLDAVCENCHLTFWYPPPTKAVK